MHCLSGGRLRMRRSVYFPDAPREETIDLPVACFLMRHRQGNVLFDTGCHPSVPDDPAARWGRWAKVTTPLMKPGENVVTGLAAIGVAADDVDVVICSHLHYDHCGCNTFFKRATVIVHAREVAAARAPNAEEMGYIAAEWDVGAPLDLVAGQRDLFGDDRIVLLPLPGHTPGTMAARVTLDRSGTFLLAADTVSVRATLDREIIPRNTWNADALVAALAEVRRIEGQGATVICGHDAVQWDTLRKGADAYD
jgi:glyoxylase-like metal-dependent hydrolase (beta-lactamase superfamily II)